MSTDTTVDPAVDIKWLTPEQVARLTPMGNADWVRQQLRKGTLRGSKIGGTWWVHPDAVREMVEAHSNTGQRSEKSQRRRRQRSVA